MLAEVGFVEARTHGGTGYRTSSCTEGALVTARKPADGSGENDPGLHARQRSGGEARPPPNGTLSCTPFHAERVKAEMPGAYRD
jgi:hypothetical protein